MCDNLLNLPATDVLTGPPGFCQMSKPPGPCRTLRLYALHAASLMEKKKRPCVSLVSLTLHCRND